MAQQYISLDHGSGGRAMAELVQQVFAEKFAPLGLQSQRDFAALKVDRGHRLVMTTDSYVVSPLFFPGGDIGSLAVHGTVNDLAMSGGKPAYLSVAFILEEGLPVRDLQRIVESMAAAARAADVAIVTGDTKVVERGKADGVFITTTGVGWVAEQRELGPQSVRQGDVVLVSGTLGDHGVSILCEREQLRFEHTIVSDSAPLNGLVDAIMVAGGSGVHCLRDLTRGGLAAAVNEIAQQAQVGVHLQEASIPIAPQVMAACELLGLDPLVIANEGKLVAFCAPEVAEDVRTAMQRHTYGQQAQIIGEVVSAQPGLVQMTTALGGRRLLDWPRGELQPRIC